MGSDKLGSWGVYPDNIQCWIYKFIIFGITIFVVTIIFLLVAGFLESKYSKGSSDSIKGKLKIIKISLLVAWGAIPPLWFTGEYFFLYLPYGEHGAFQFFKYGQEVASKLWGAAFVLISFSLYKQK